MKNTSEINTASATPTNVQKMAEGLVSALAQRPGHELTWIASRFSEYAQARLKDEVQETFKKAFHQLNDDERRAWGVTLAIRVLRSASYVTNKSTSFGDNAMKEATIAAEAAMADECLRGTLYEMQNEAWATVKAAQAAEKAAVDHLIAIGEAVAAEQKGKGEATP